MEWREENHPRDEKGQFAEKHSRDSDITMKKSKDLYSKDKVVMLPKQEYAELCSAIRTEFGNKIPKNGGMLYKDSYYMYNYSKKKELIICTYKIEIEGNEDIVVKQEELLNAKKRKIYSDRRR